MVVVIVVVVKVVVIIVNSSRWYSVVNGGYRFNVVEVVISLSLSLFL